MCEKMANPIDYFGDITLHGGALKSVALEAVDALPESPVEKQIVVFNKTVQIYIDGKWTVLGSTKDIESVQTALDTLDGKVTTLQTGKVDKVEGKGLSTNDYTTEEKNKLAGIAEGAQVNVIESVEVDGVAQTIDAEAKKVTLDLSKYAKKTDLASVLDWKGTVATVSALPTKESGAKKGDVYHVIENSAEYAFDGTDWQELGSEINLSVYYTKTEIDDKVTAINNTLETKVDKLAVSETRAGTYTKVTINAEGQVTGGEEKIAVADISDFATTIASAEVAIAGKLKTARNFSITGGAKASAVAFDGTDAVALNVTSIDGTKVSGLIPVASVPEIGISKITNFATEVKSVIRPQFVDVKLNESGKVAMDGNKYTITTQGKAYGVMVLHSGVQVFVSTTITDSTIVLDFNSAITASEFTVSYIQKF